MAEVTLGRVSLHQMRAKLRHWGSPSVAQLSGGQFLVSGLSSGTLRGIESRVWPCGDGWIRWRRVQIGDGGSPGLLPGQIHSIDLLGIPLLCRSDADLSEILQPFGVLVEVLTSVSDRRTLPVLSCRVRLSLGCSLPRFVRFIRPGFEGYIRIQENIDPIIIQPDEFDVPPDYEAENSQNDDDVISVEILEFEELQAVPLLLGKQLSEVVPDVRTNCNAVPAVMQAEFSWDPGAADDIQFVDRDPSPLPTQFSVLEFAGSIGGSDLPSIQLEVLLEGPPHAGDPGPSCVHGQAHRASDHANSKAKGPLTKEDVAALMGVRTRSRSRGRP